MKVLIVEDEAPAVRRLKALLMEISPELEILGSCDSIESSVIWLSSNPSPDVIFLDIHLSDGNSFEIFNKIIPNSYIIFTTAYDEYAIQAFKLKSIGYLLKPIQKQELMLSLDKLKEWREAASPDLKSVVTELKNLRKEYKQRFLVKAGDRLIPVPIHEIIYFYSEEKLVLIQTPSQKYPVDYTLDELEEILDPKLYFRFNRQLLGKTESISKIFNHLNGRLKLVLQPPFKEDVYVSREKASDFKKWMEG